MLSIDGRHRRGVPRRGAGRTVAGRRVLRGHRGPGGRGRERPAARRAPDHEPRRRSGGGCWCAPTPTPARTRRGPGGSARRASACAAPSTCSSGSVARPSSGWCWPRPTPSGRRPWPSCCRCSAATSSRSSRRWPGRPSRSGCSTRRCTSSCPTSPSCRSRSRCEHDHGEHIEQDERLLAAVRRLHEENPMLGLRGVRLGIAVKGLFGMQVRAIAQAAAEVRRRGLEVRAADHGPAGRLGAGAADGGARRPPRCWPRRRRARAWSWAPRSAR